MPALWLAAAAVLALAGCAPAVVVVGAATYGAAVVHDRRSAQTVLDDEAIELKAKHQYLQDRSIADHSRIRVVSFNYTVLLAGQAAEPAVSQRFAEVVAGLPKVERVYNEVEIGPNIDLAQQGRDAMISTRGNVALASLGIPGFDPTRVKVIVENGSLFLMGLVTPEEADASAEKLRRLPGVTRVVKLFDYLDASAAAPAASPRASDGAATGLTPDELAAPAPDLAPDLAPAPAPAVEPITDPEPVALPDDAAFDDAGDDGYGALPGVDEEGPDL